MRALIDVASGKEQNNPRYKDMIDRKTHVQESATDVIGRIKAKLMEG